MPEVSGERLSHHELEHDALGLDDRIIELVKNNLPTSLFIGSRSGGTTQPGTGLDEKVKVSADDTTEGYLNGKLVAGSGITLTENNPGANETLTVASSVTQYTDEMVDDRVSALMIPGKGTTWQYDDFLGTLKVNIALHEEFTTTNLPEGLGLYYTDERVDDRVASLLVAGTNIGLTYSDGAGTLTIDAAASASAGAFYVTIGNTGVLSAERALTGTANQIVVTDNGANSTVVLSTPQNIHTGSSPTFTNLTLTGTLNTPKVLSQITGINTATSYHTVTLDYQAGFDLVGSSSIAYYAGITSNGLSASAEGTVFGYMTDITSHANDTADLAYVGNFILFNNTAGAANKIGMYVEGEHTATIAAASDVTIQSFGGKVYISPADTDAVIIGTTAPLFNTKLYVQETYTGTDDHYSTFAAGIFDPTANNAAIVSAFSFLLNTTGNKTLTGQLKGFDGTLFHDGTGTLTQALGGNFIVKKLNTGAVTSMFGLNLAIGNYHVTGNVTNGISLQIAAPNLTGTFTNVFGTYYFNQGGANVTSSAAIYIAAQSGSSSLNAAVYIEGGTFQHNTAQNATSDFTILGDTDADLVQVDVSADAVGIGVALGAITAGIKLEVDGNFLASNVKSGTYTPTRSAEANMTGTATMSQAQWSRVGNVVTVSGRFTATATLTATTTSVEITLPVASNIGATEDLAGTAFCGNIVSMGAEVTGVVANDTAKIFWKSTDITSQTFSYIFSYEIL